MDPKKDFKKFFQKMFNTPVDIQGEILTSEELTKKNFIIFVDNYKKAVTRSQEAGTRRKSASSPSWRTL